jgi:hypothetical protein
MSLARALNALKYVMAGEDQQAAHEIAEMTRWGSPYDSVVKAVSLV